MSQPAISFERVTKYYDKTTLALDDFSLEIDQGEFLTIIGSSGCGKTTALKMINGLLVPDRGRVTVLGEDVSKVDLIQLRRKIGYAIQGVGLFPHMTVGRNIAYVPSLSKLWTKDQEKREVRELLLSVDLDPEMESRYPSELSGGQRQRVGIARALAAKPSVLLMDEPFGAVDEITRKSLQDEILEIQKRLHVTIVFVTHDIKEAMTLGDRVLIMAGGKRLQIDTPERIKASPKTEFVERLINQ